MKKNGFTLVELLAVIAILAILILIALPNVMSIFNESKKESFTNEVKQIHKTAEQQWMNDSMLETNEVVYARCDTGDCTKSLKLSGRSEIHYYIKVNKLGKVTELYVEDGTYQYSYSGTGLNIEDITDVIQISQIEESNKISISCSGVSGNSGSGGSSTTIVPVDPYITVVTRANPNTLTVDDEVAIGSEHFYVIATNSNQTTLLSKYNLYVGATITQTCTSADCAISSKSSTAISKSDSKYGLQNSLANAYNYIAMSANHSSMYGKSSTSYGFVAFSGTNYWDNSVCEYRLSHPSNEQPYKCQGTSGLSSDYSNSSNAAGTTNYVSVYPYVYNDLLYTIEMSYIFNITSGGYVSNNGYTIAYYVEEYITRLRSLGASSNITGRLLTYEEANSLSSNTKGGQSYWCGSARNSSAINVVSKGKNIMGSTFVYPSAGTRPVIVVPTSEIEI